MCVGQVDEVTVMVPANVWEGEGAVLTCTPSVGKANTQLLVWYKNAKSNSDTVYVYGDHTDTKAYHALQNRAVGQWVGDVHQLHISRTILTDEDIYICIVGAARDSKKMTVNCKYLVIMLLLVKTKISICQHFNRWELSVNLKYCRNMYLKLNIVNNFF